MFIIYLLFKMNSSHLKIYIKRNTITQLWIKLMNSVLNFSTLRWNWPERRTQTETKGLLWGPPAVPFPASATARASSIHATTSLNAAAAMAVSPTRVVRSLSSARIRASTGKAVMDRATPMNTIYWANPTLSAPSMVFRRTKAIPIPRMKGSEIPAAAIPKALFPLLRIEPRSSSRPTKNRKKRRPMLATDSRIGVLHFGNILLM